MAQDNLLKEISERFVEFIPHCKDMGMEIIETGTGYTILRQPYRPELMGDKERGFTHSSVMTSLVDTASGMAVFMSLAEYETIATLDLRMDYLRPAIIEQPIYAKAECYRLTSQIAFVRAIAYQQSPIDPIATSQSTFMRSSSKSGIKAK